MATKSTKKKKNSKQQNKQTSSQNFLKDEVVILITLAFCIILLISNFGIGGTVGGAISSFVFGVFGLLAYLVPIFLFLGVAFVFSNKGNIHAYIKVLIGFLGTVMICALLQLITVSFKEQASLYSYFQYSSTQKQGGGIVGGFLVRLLCPSF
ncbi:MAG: DNA translocase FtsK, partial [Lachnospiraceae bacterium]